MPVFLADVVVRPPEGDKKEAQGAYWRVVDKNGRVLPAVIDGELTRWQMAAASAARRVDLFGEWQGRLLCPLSLWIDGKCVCPNRS